MGDYRLAAELIDQLQSQLTAITADRDNLRERLGEPETEYVKVRREDLYLLTCRDEDVLFVNARERIKAALEEPKP